MLTLLLLLHVDAPHLARPDELDRALDQRVVPILDLIAPRPSLHLALHLAGPLVERAVATRHPALAALRELVRRGQVEVVGGAWHEVLLCAIPEVDATGQVQYASGVIREQTGVQPTGAWLPLLYWDPAFPRLLQAAGIRYTFTDAARFVAAGIPEPEAQGHFTAERLGAAVAVFPLSGAARRLLLAAAPEAVPATLVGLAGGRARASLSALVPRGLLADPPRLVAVVDAIVGESHRVRTALFQDHLEKVPSSGRVALPAGLPEPSLRRSLAASVAERYGEVIAALEAADVRESAEPFLVRDQFDSFLSRYPEANLLHKRMLRVSQRVDRLRRSVRESLRRDPLASPRAHEALALACARMWRAQSHAAYWHGEHAGLYDRDLRHQAYRDLLLAERVAEDALGEAPTGFTQALVDLDCDGHREIAADTPCLRGVWSRRAGGGLTALELRSHALSLLPVVRRHEEPYHGRLAWTGVQLVDPTDPLSADMALEAPAPLSPDAAEGALQWDSEPRAAFVDHLLGADTTPAAFARRQYREVGDFLRGPYEMVNGGLQGPSVALGRAGVADDLHHKSLLRIEKSFALDPSAPVMLVRYRLVNRSFDPTRFWWGTEVNLDPPGPNPESWLLAVRCRDGEKVHAAEEAFEEEAVSTIRVEGGDASVVLAFAEPIDLWYHPIRTVTRAEGAYRLLHQGLCLLLHRRFALWGAEETQLAMRLEVKPEASARTGIVEPSGEHAFLASSAVAAAPRRVGRG